LYYELHGPEGGQPLVLLEGMGGDILGWRRNIPRLSEHLRVLAFDFRGNGRSDLPGEGLTVGTLVEDTLALLDGLGIGAAHVYGQSMGGLVAQQMAVEHADRLRSLILGCTYPGRKHQVPIRAKVPKDRPWLALYAPRFAEQHPEHVAEDLRLGARQPQSAVGRLRQWEAIRDFDPYDRLPEIRVPTLVLHGTEDLLVHPDNARVLADRIPGARLVLLDGAGHVYHSERPEEADRAVLDFIRTL
jgi:3-oxoadipate enol-lactonase